MYLQHGKSTFDSHGKLDKCGKISDHSDNQRSLRKIDIHGVIIMLKYEYKVEWHVCGSKYSFIYNYRKFPNKDTYLTRDGHRIFYDSGRVMVEYMFHDNTPPAPE